MSQNSGSQNFYCDRRPIPRSHLEGAEGPPGLWDLSADTGLTYLPEPVSQGGFRLTLDSGGPLSSHRSGH